MCSSDLGQGWEIPVVLPARRYTEADRDLLRDLFSQAYQRFFGRTIDTLPIQVVSFTVKASSPLPPVARIADVASITDVTSTTTRALFDSALDREVQAQVHERTNLRIGDRVHGPAVVVEAETATVITSSFTATVQGDGSLLLETRNR